MSHHRLTVRNRVKCRTWFRRYRLRIRAGLELCRQCAARSTELRLAHLIPHSRGGSYTLDNLTILCEPCDLRQGTELSLLRSLADEESEYGVPLLPADDRPTATEIPGVIIPWGPA